MCKRRQSEVTMVLAIIQKEKQQPTNYKIIGTNYLQQSFEEQNSFVLEKKYWHVNINMISVWNRDIIISWKIISVKHFYLQNYHRDSGWNIPWSISQHFLLSVPFDIKNTIKL